jgi:hypothetical protein
MRMGLGLGLGAHRYAGGSSVIAPETYGLLARSIDADTLAGADGSGVSSWPNVSTDAPAVPGYVQATAGNQPVLGTANGHRFVKRSGGNTLGTVSYMTTASNSELNDTHLFAVVRVIGSGTSTLASSSTGSTKFEAKGTTTANIGPRLVGSDSPWNSTLDQENVGWIPVNTWVVVEAELYTTASAGTAMRVGGTTVDSTTNGQIASITMNTLFSSYTGVRTDTAVALMRVYSLSGGAMAPADVIGARALMQARANALNGV